MSDFLLGFSRALVHRLLAEEKLEVTAGSSDRVVMDLARHLAELGEGKSLLSSVEACLLAHPDVEEMFFDLEELKGLVEGLR